MRPIKILSMSMRLSTSTRALGCLITAVSLVFALATIPATAGALTVFSEEPPPASGQQCLVGPEPPGCFGVALRPKATVELTAFFTEPNVSPEPDECSDYTVGELVNNGAPIDKLAFHGPWRNACAAGPGWTILKGSITKLELEETSPGNGEATMSLKGFEIEPAAPKCVYKQITPSSIEMHFTRGYPAGFFSVAHSWEGKLVGTSCKSTKPKILALKVVVSLHVPGELSFVWTE
jgi:hypothetical protein